MIWFCMSAIRGSSPRMRGAVRELREGIPLARIIPAHAGSSKSRQVTSRQAWDHPRACGEQLVRRLPDVNLQGSSPRMRGAGPTRSLTSDSRRDHPRACGEQWLIWFCMSAILGSSPRMRGAARRGGRAQQERRIIPAHAGSSWPLSDAPAETPGSSPRMWGAGHVKRPQGNRFRIIPAHAGSRSSGTGPTSGRRDHPRACGEQVVLASGTMSVSGSSPRMRGAERSLNLNEPRVGIIPAHAGSSESAT